MLLRPEKPGSWPVDEAVQEVAPLLVSTLASGCTGRSARIGSFCRVVAASARVQAWVGAVWGGSKREPDLQGSS